MTVKAYMKLHNLFCILDILYEKLWIEFVQIFVRFFSRFLLFLFWKNKTFLFGFYILISKLTSILSNWPDLSQENFRDILKLIHQFHDRKVIFIRKIFMIRLMTDVRSLRVDFKKFDHNMVELFHQSGNYHHPRPFLYHETS